MEPRRGVTVLSRYDNDIYLAKTPPSSITSFYVACGTPCCAASIAPLIHPALRLYNLRHYMPLMYKPVNHFFMMLQTQYNLFHLIMLTV